MSLPGWKRAYEAVWTLLPNTRGHIGPEPRYCITPGGLWDKAEQAGFIFEIKDVPEWEAHEWGAHIYSKMDLFDMMFHDVDIPSGELIFIPDCCFPQTKHEPFFYCGDSLRSFVAECPFFVFDADVVFIWPDAKYISCFYHKGKYAHIDCKMIPR